MTGCEWRYLAGGRVIHALPRRGGDLAWVARCGVSPRWGGDWWGTGAQAEYETVQRLPMCRRCLARLGLPG